VVDRFMAGAEGNISVAPSSPHFGAACAPTKPIG
jgi:hypothetical protein